jgi:hypothetical protein
VEWEVTKWKWPLFGWSRRLTVDLEIPSLKISGTGSRLLTQLMGRKVTMQLSINKEKPGGAGVGDEMTAIG